jgi:asparagine synthetase B (glutamine-hydrolysing)
VLDGDQQPDYETFLENRWPEPDSRIYSGVCQAKERLLVEKDVRAVISGNGGDQLFGHSLPPYYLAEWFAFGKWDRWLDGVRDCASHGGHSLWKLLWFHTLGDLRYQPHRPRLTHANALVWLTPEFREICIRIEAERTPRRLGPLAQAGREHQLRLIMRTGTEHEHPHARFPLLYRPLVEFMLAVPWELKSQPDRHRVLQRAAMRGLLPEGIRTRLDKRGATESVLKGFAARRPAFMRLREGRAMAALGIVEPERFRRACDVLRHGVVGNELTYFVAALAFEAWLGLRDQNDYSTTIPGIADFFRSAATSCG